MAEDECWVTPEEIKLLKLTRAPQDEMTVAFFAGDMERARAALDASEKAVGEFVRAAYAAHPEALKSVRANHPKYFEGVADE